MPFKTPSSLPSSRVEIIFRGLLLIQPNENGTSCEVGVHNKTNDHLLQISVTRDSKTLGGTDYLGIHQGQIKRTLSNDVTIMVENSTGGVYAYKPTATPPEFDRSKPNDKNDLQWAIDLQNSKEFHTGSLSMFPAGTSPRVKITDGVFFTAERTDETEIKITRKGGGKTDLNMPSIAKVIGVRFNLAANSHVVIELRENDFNRTLRLPQDEDPSDTTYEVYIKNDPLRYGLGVGHDELEQYYDVLLKDGGPLGSSERFALITELVHPIGPKNTDRIPCMPVLIGG